MSRFLFAVFPATGHINPGLPIARELVARGHSVRWYSTPRFRRAIEATGAVWVPFKEAIPVDEAGMEDLFPNRPKGGIKQLQYDVSHIFVGIIPGALHDLEEELAQHPADVLVSDNTFGVCKLIHERKNIPWAVFGITTLSMPSRDTAPFGLALEPSSTPLGRLRNRALNWLVEHVIFRDARARLADIRECLGMPKSEHGLFDAVRAADLYLQGSVPSFEYPRTDMPPNVRFIGATIPDPPADWRPPHWWGELEGHRNGRRVVLVTQGTINNDYDQLIRPAIRALCSENVLVVVTTGNREPSAVEMRLPANVRVERFIPYAHLMPKVDLLLTNGGYGTIQIALAHGVPVVAIGKSEEKPEIANRVEWSGVGVGLKVLVPTEEQIRNAVARVLSDVTYRARANAIRYEMSGLDAASTGAELLEELAGANPLVRSWCA
jgi:MGT family glycosyltransferase